MQAIYLNKYPITYCKTLEQVPCHPILNGTINIADAHNCYKAAATIFLIRQSQQQSLDPVSYPLQATNHRSTENSMNFLWCLGTLIHPVQFTEATVFTGVLQDNCSEKFPRTHSKTLVIESFLKKLQ